MEDIYQMGAFALQSGVVLPNTKLSYSAHGELNDAHDNVIVYPTWATGRHSANEVFVGPGRALDPQRYFIVIPDMFTNGLSTSPSTCDPPYDGPRFPLVTAYDNVRAQHQLLVEHLGVTRIQLAIGFSMSGQQAFHWGAHYPNLVERVCSICGSARTATHNWVYLSALQAVMESADGWKEGECRTWPPSLLRALMRVGMTMLLSQDWYRAAGFKLAGASTAEEFITGGEALLADWVPMDFYHQLETWLAADVSANPMFNDDFDKALGSIRSRALVMPCDTDMYFRVEDNELEVAKMPNAELRVIHSMWGHAAGFPGQSPDDDMFIDGVVKEFLDG
ncbi:MAG: alpha/beta fold hydrolase [Vicinamibacterales bacterium]|nr:alpha/beta fold hydrolase [Vicinamibacterales bacterium]